MKLFSRRNSVKLARVLLILIIADLIRPLSAFALTSGPGQPEVQSFVSLSSAGMVDPFTGDLNYSIPLLEIDGYPLKLDYHSGVGMEDEASWVGLGWNLNVGAISRQLRGIPDDANGDTVAVEHYVKPKITAGGRVNVKTELFGSQKIFKGNATFTVGLFSDNYTGLGAEVGVNAGISYGHANDGSLVAGLGLGVLSSTSSGVDKSPYASLSVYELSQKKRDRSSSLSGSLGFNSRTGLKTYGFGLNGRYFNTSMSTVSFNSDPINPNIEIPFKTNYQSYSFDVGPTAGGAFFGGGGTGYLNKRSIKQRNLLKWGYGFLYAYNGRKNPDAIMDFVREKENAVIPGLPNLALPVHTPDIFNFSNGLAAGQFRLYRGGTGIFFDNQAKDEYTGNSFGGDLGFGNGYHIGVTYFNQKINSVTQQWLSENKYAQVGDFQGVNTVDPKKQHAFFRLNGETTAVNQQLSDKLVNGSLVTVKTTGKVAESAFTAPAQGSQTEHTIGSAIEQEQKQPQGTVVSYLTAGESMKAGLDKTLKTYSFNNSQGFVPVKKPSYLLSQSRRDSTRKRDHISEITVNAKDGSRAVYGLPVYNLRYEEYTFALSKNYVSKNGLVELPNGIEQNKGNDHYFHKQTIPSHAYSYLLTGMLSADYQDKTGDGVTEDDIGNAIKFNYSRINRYGWRTPYRSKFSEQGTLQNSASLNRGLLADPDDDRGNIIYGEKEIYYASSIESKTKIAYFITEDRLDGIGVTDINGGLANGTYQKKLMEIRLYSKANMSKPIKVVKFGYDYELCSNTPNSSGESRVVGVPPGGKLTLKKIWFEYGTTHKGKYHNYKFDYNNKINTDFVDYATMHMDRWGTFKFPAGNKGQLTNEEYPYADQDKVTADKAASLWNLSRITLPTGGIINIDYESDDYAYVQNKRASRMVDFELITDTYQPITTLKNAVGIKINISENPPAGIDQTKWFKDRYLNGSEYLYTKSYVKLSTSNAPSYGKDFDFVPVYSKVTSVNISQGVANIKFERITEGGATTNPIRHAAWQKMKNEYPMYAYPGYQNKVSDVLGGVFGAVRSLVSAVGNLSEFLERFYHKANRKDYANQTDPQRSFARISVTSGFKLGGGSRVKMVKIEDDWGAMSGQSVGQGVYGQTFDYTTVEGGQVISSGVAAYEPSVGSDENSMRQPIPYVQNIKGAINNFFELEEPFGESFFPPPGVGYRKVTIRDLGAGGTQTSSPRTGSQIVEYYSAKEFPVRVNYSKLSPYNPKPAYKYSVVTTHSIEELVMSQGYVIEVNDMHGKPKATRNLDKSGAEISSVEYSYQVEDERAPELKLNNVVNVVNQVGEVNQRSIGQVIEFFTDFREQSSSNTGLAVNIGLDIIGFPPFFIPIPHVPVNSNNEYKLFRSACAVKLVQLNGILRKVVKTDKGSSIATENVLFDAGTGDPIVSRTQNEFGKYHYTTEIPAYFTHKKMGGGYQNLGTLLRGITLNSYKEINQPANSVLSQGDELIDLSSGISYWVIEEFRASNVGETVDISTRFKLITRQGMPVNTVSQTALFKLIRSGYRNQLNATTNTVVSMNNPIINGHLNVLSHAEIGASLKVLDASVTEFDQQWPVNILGQHVQTIENNSATFKYVKAGNSSFHGQRVRYYNCPGTLLCGDSATIMNNFLKARLDQIGIFPGNTIPENCFDEPVGFKTSFYAPTSKTYYIGFAADDRLAIQVDNGAIQITNTRNNSRAWTIQAIQLDEGVHQIDVQAVNDRNANNAYNNLADNPGSIGIEIYNASLPDIINSSNVATLNPIFQTSSLIGKTDLQSFRTINNTVVWHLSYQNYYNPFVNGMLGNWRPSANKVFQSTRTYENPSGTSPGVNVNNSGYYKIFNGYWSFDSFTQGYSAYNGPLWLAANMVTLYDKFGQELENKDALGRFTAADFDFDGSFASAVATNAKHREIFSNGFEDTGFNIANGIDTLQTRFIRSSGQNLSSALNGLISHSGVYSINVDQSGVVLNTIMHSNIHKTESYLLKQTGYYQLVDKKGLYPKGFEPEPSKLYLLSMWVKDALPANKSVNVAVSIQGNSTPVPVNLSCKAVVEGWKLLEGQINTGQVSGINLKLTVKANTGQVQVDDLRIHPYNGNMKTFVYNESNYRLMAELDENCMATFYEYDDEGKLTRLKKETERGIQMIRENKSSQRKQL